MPVFLVGAGPGYTDLITVRGLNLLRKADIVVYDALANGDLLDECKTAELVDVGKRCNNHKMTQTEINTLLVDLGKSGKNIVRLKGGDPFLFGRGAEEAAALRNSGIEVHVVPGVSSSISVPELAGIPVTHRDHAPYVTIVTGHRREGADDRYWEKLASTEGTLVILMGMSNAEEITEGLVKGGMGSDTPAAIITSGAGPDQRTETTILSKLSSTIKEKALQAPGIIVIGSSVEERDLLGDLA
ncbi:MAG: uroporphyrinogen-III C-methyltransferase [Candidatus Methanoplasma sp.]|jgi:uroporphyrin-III C-methyltransferase|nr:uroporphyrinogen-III C-methyltransferase [Candidatus Methanoplasma sp.]